MNMEQILNRLLAKPWLFPAKDMARNLAMAFKKARLFLPAAAGLHLAIFFSLKVQKKVKSSK